MRRSFGVDAALAGAVAGVVCVAIATSTEPSARPIWVAYAFAAAFGLLMFARRDQPVLVVAVTCLGLVGYYAAGLPRIGLAVPVAAALYSATEAGQLWTAVGGALGLLIYTYGYRISAGQDPRFLLGYELATNLAIIASVIALGDGVRSRRQLIAEREEVTRRREAEREADARRRVADERLRIARELHDALGHAVVALSLHTNAAIEALDADDVTAARASMSRVQVAGSTTMRELRASVGLLRQPSATAGGGLADVDRLLEVVRAAGVRPRVTGDLARLSAGLPAAVAEAAYRIVQESTSNAIRHAEPRTLELEVWRSPTALEIRVFNDGVRTGPRRSAADGNGLTGMRERAKALGGTVHSTLDDKGFLVVAVLPLDEAADG